MNNTAHASIADPSHGLHEPRVVLVVEDDPAVLELFTIMLARQGYKVLPAEGAPEALAAAKAWTGDPIDLLITDLSMPSRNGDDLAAELCALLPELKVLYVSGYPADDPFPVSLDLHNAIFLPKPVDPHAVQKAIRALFNSTPAEVAAA